MMSFNKIGLVIAMGIVFFSGSAFADLTNGKVVSFDSATRKITLSTSDPASGAAVNLNVWVNGDAGLKGFSSLEEIQKGDSVWVEASTDSEGNLRASEVVRG